MFRRAVPWLARATLVHMDTTLKCKGLWRVVYVLGVMTCILHYCSVCGTFETITYIVFLFIFLACGRAPHVLVAVMLTVATRV